MFANESDYFIKCSQSDLKKILLNIPFDLLKLAILALPRESQKRILKNLANPIAEDLRAYIVLKKDLISWNVLSEITIHDACSEANKVIEGLGIGREQSVLPDLFAFTIHDIGKLTDEELRLFIAQLDENLIFFSFLETGEKVLEKVINILPKNQALKLRAISRLKSVLYESGVIQYFSIFENERKVSDILLKTFPDKTSDNSLEFF